MGGVEGVVNVVSAVTVSVSGHVETLKFDCSFSSFFAPFALPSYSYSYSYSYPPPFLCFLFSLNKGSALSINSCTLSCNEVNLNSGMCMAYSWLSACFLLDFSAILLARVNGEHTRRRGHDERNRSNDTGGHRAGGGEYEEYDHGWNLQLQL